MYQLSLSEAQLLVRRNFDEQMENDSNMLGVDSDSEQFDSLLAKMLPDAINAVHANAPIQLLEGKFLDVQTLGNIKVVGDVLYFGIRGSFLRMVAFKTEMSPLICDAIPEYSVEGRLQLNPYTKGTYDRPKLVLVQGREQSNETSFRYYSLYKIYSNEDAFKAIERCEYIPRYRYDESTVSYGVAENVVENVIDYLTAQMMLTYNEADKATFYFNKAVFGKQ